MGTGSSSDKMQRYFAPIENGYAIFSEESAHHLLHVMRMGKGDEIEIVDEGDVFLASIEETDPLRIKILHEVIRDVELKADLFLAFALLKGGHDDLVYQKGTELGVKGFLPFLSKRTIIRLEGEKDKKKRQERAEKIIRNAAEQSKRNLVPEVKAISSYKEVLSIPAEHKLIAYENLSGEEFDLPKAFQSVKPGERVIILIGPEGGFTPEEVAMAEEAGYRSVSLGKRILRAESASLYAAAAFAYQTENLQ